MKPVHNKMYAPVRLVKGKNLIEKKQVNADLFDHIWHELWVEVNNRFEDVRYLIEYDIAGWNN